MNAAVRKAGREEAWTRRSFWQAIRELDSATLTNVFTMASLADSDADEHVRKTNRSALRCVRHEIARRANLRLQEGGVR